MTAADLVRQQGEMLIEMAKLMEKEAPFQQIMNRLDLRYPRCESLNAVQMAGYWGVSENTARDRMHAAGFPAEEFKGRLVVSKVALALYEITRTRKCSEPDPEVKAVPLIRSNGRS